MPNAFKPSGAKAIDSRRDRFWSARTQLTITYTAILAVILLIASSITYTAFSNRLRERFNRFPPRPPINMPEGALPPRPEEVLRDLLYSLVFVNGLLLVLASGASYWLAGTTLEPIREAYERQRRFLGDASHELRTPLAILQADLENSLSASKISKEVREQAESHLEEVRRMGQIVKDLLLLSHLDEITPSEEAHAMIDLVSFLEGITERFQHFAHQHAVTLGFHSPLSRLTFVTKQELLSQAVSNIVKNAIIYNKQGGTVTLELTHDRSIACIQIQDTGIGISKKDVDKIFDRFYRVDKSRSRQTGGSGLGLSITRSIVEQLHGSIEIKSELGTGTLVTLTFPISKTS